MINQQWLHTFLNLVEVGHFTKTAEKLFMTQPGVSQQIKKLEEQIGVPLLIRIGKGFELTREGEILYQFGCKRRREEQLLHRKLQFDDPYSGECRIGCSGAMAIFLYPHLLKRQKDHSGLVMDVEAAPAQRIIQSIQQNKSDLGIVTQTFPLPELAYESLGYESLCLVLPSCFASSLLTFDHLKMLGFINHPDGSYYADRLLSANFGEQFHSVGRIKKSGYINQINQILSPVSEGLGFTVLPETAVRNFPQQSLLYVAPLPVPIRDELFWVSKKHRILPKRYEWFKGTIEKLFRT